MFAWVTPEAGAECLPTADCPALFWVPVLLSGFIKALLSVPCLLGTFPSCCRAPPSGLVFWPAFYSTDSLGAVLGKLFQGI